MEEKNNNYMEVLVSIIVPVYNSEEYLSKTLNSIMNQTYKEFEVLLIDDGSKDRSGIICDAYSERDTRFRTIHVCNGGVGRARNIGINNSRGQYLLFVDSDDLCESNYVSDLVENTTGNTLVMAGLKCFKNNQITSIINQPTASMGVTDYLINILSKENISQYCGGPYCKLYKKDIIMRNSLRFEEKTSYAEDFCFNMNYLQLIDKVFLTGHVIYLYRDHEDNSLSHDYSRFNFKTYWKRYYTVYLSFQNVFKKYQLSEKCRDDIEYMYKYYVLRILRQNVLYVNNKKAQQRNAVWLRKNYPLTVRNQAYRMSLFNRVTLRLYEKGQIALLNHYLRIKYNFISMKHKSKSGRFIMNKKENTVC